MHFGTMHLVPLSVPEEVEVEDSSGSSEWAQVCGMPHKGSVLNVGPVTTGGPRSKSMESGGEIILLDAVREERWQQ